MGSPPQFQSFNSMSSVMFSDCTIAIGCFNSDHDHDHYEWEGLQWQPITALLWLLVWLLLPIPKSAKGYFRCLPQSISCRVPVPIWLFAEHWESSTQTVLENPFKEPHLGTVRFADGSDLLGDCPLWGLMTSSSLKNEQKEKVSFVPRSNQVICLQETIVNVLGWTG